MTGDQVVIGFRPEAMQLASAGDPASFPVQALVIEELGADAYLYGDLVGGELRSDHIVARIEPRSVPEKGATVHFTVRPGQLHAFDAETGLALPTD
jgi:multiple sugar transport system ATP-binding protein